jgi:probable phosphomutase (TIGR03848 family)
MPIILLIRHGENDYVKTGKFAGRLPGVHLNAKGKLEASELADGLKDVPLSAIYSSPLERAIETAQPLAKAKKLKITIDEGLIETDIGDWKGMEIKKARKLPEWKNVQNSPSRFRFPKGESFQEEQTRLVNAMERIIEKHKKDELVAIFSHADPIKLIIAYYLGMHLDHFQRLGCNTGSISTLAISLSGITALGINLRPPFHIFVPKAKSKRH